MSNSKETKKKVINYMLQNKGVLPKDMSWSLVAKKFKVQKSQKRSPGKKANDIWWDYVRSNKTKIRNSRAKILVLDIETAPILAFVWGLWKQNINTNFIQKDWFILSWSAKWLYDDQVVNDFLRPDEIQKQDDKRICESVFSLMDEADIIIAHNGDKFDFRKLNARFLLNGLGRPSSFMSIDTLKHARKHLAISSNKLSYLAEVLGVTQKIEVSGQKLWERCMKGEVEAMKTMVEYCDGDVVTLEEVYLELRPFIKPHPNLNLFVDHDDFACPTCASKELKHTGSEYITTMNTFDEYVCNSCGSSCRNKSANKRNKNITSSLPR